MWSFPCEALPTIVAGLEANGVDVVVNDYQPKVEIVEKNAAILSSVLS